MATDRVGIEIEVLGYDEAMNQMKSLEQSYKGLGGRKQVLKVQAEVEQLKMNRTALRENKVKIKADMSQVDKEIARVKKRIKELENQKPLWSKGSTRLKEITAEVGRLKNELASLQNQKLNLKEQFAQTSAEIGESTAKINELNASLRNAGMAGKSLKQIFNSISSSVSHAGMALQSAGNALTRFSSPFRTIMRGSLYAGGFAMLNMASQGISNATQRYDILKTYVPIMEALGNKSDEAEKAIERLNEAVIGIPTGLDEIVEEQKLLTMATRDMTKATDLAIASNNAWVASGADESRVTMAKKELQTLAQTGKLNERQWMTMQKGMSVTWGEIEKRMQSTGKIQTSLLEALKSGKVSADEFMDALTWEGLHGRTKAVRDEIAHTYASVSSNIQNAFSRLGYNVLSTLDEVLKAATGKDTIDTLIGFTKGIDRMSEGIQNWIKANPDTILNFMDALKSFDWAGLGKGISEGVKAMAEFATVLLKFPGARFLGWLMTFGSVFGSVFTIAGGLLKGNRHPLAGIATLFVGLGRLFGGSGLGGKISGIGKWLKNIGTLKTATDTAEAAAESAATKSISLKNHFKNIAKGLSGVGAVAGGILIIGGTVFATVKMIKSIVKDLGTISTDIGDIDPGAMKKLAQWMINIGGVFATLGVIAGAAMRTPIGASVIVGIEAGLLAIGTIITTISGFAWLNSKLISGTLKNFVNAVKSVKQIVDGINDLSGVRIKKKGIKDAISAISEIAPLLKLSYKDEYGRNVHVSASSIKKAKKVFENMAGIVKSIKQTANNLKDLADIDVSGAKENVKNIVSDLSEIYGELQSSFEVDTKKDVKGTGNANDLISNMSSIIGQIKSTVENLKALAESEIDFEGANAAADSIVTNMHQLYDKIVNAFSPEQTTDLGERGNGRRRTVTKGGKITKGQVNNASNMQSMISSISQTLSQLRGIYDTLAGDNGLQNVDTAALDTAAANAETVIEKIKEIALKMQGMQTETLDANFENVKSAVAKIRNIVYTFNGLGVGPLASTDSAVFTAINNIKKMISELGNALNTAGIADLQAQVDAFKSAVDGVFEALNSALSDIKVTVKINGKVKGHKALISAIKAANDAIKNAVGKIKTSYTKSVSVRINPTVSVGRVPTPNIPGVHPYTGGYIGKNRLLYRAKGGEIGFMRPKGTDTVPAMLTPGEYVHNRNAVRFFGVEFMRKINNLDVAGAMRELSARAGMRQTGVRSTTINNNITNNNNPTINQNITTSNPNFAFKRSSRYVAAL